MTNAPVEAGKGVEHSSDGRPAAPNKGKYIFGLIPRTPRGLWGCSFAGIGLGITAFVLWRYWPDITSSEPKPPLILTFFVGEPPSPKLANRVALFGLLAAWAIVPSLWFLADWVLNSPYSEDLPPDASDTIRQNRAQMVEEFKYTQSLARALWVAVLASLAVLCGVSLTVPGGS